MIWRLVVAVLLVLAGLTSVIINGRKLISDWPRPKPRHNVDVAWIQVYLGVAAVLVAWALVRNPAHWLFEPIPQVVSGDTAQTTPRAP